FSHVGGFGIRAAKLGAKKVVMVDASDSALALAKEIAQANAVSERCEFIRDDVMEWLPEHRAHYDLIVCDPPALIKNRSAMANGIRAYTSLNRRAMHHLKRDGMLLTFSCSQLLQRPMFLQMLRDAARNEPLFLHSEWKQAPDHPILLAHPETEYLKGAMLVQSLMS
ncbi:MAG: methyltransferase, partial [bacterium]|nr:methyltransferase [bacterium]